MELTDVNTNFMTDHTLNQYDYDLLNWEILVKYLFYVTI